MAPVQKANDDNSEKFFRSSTQKDVLSVLIRIASS